jgi:hypothetical protein
MADKVDVIEELQSNAFKQMVSKGIRIMLFQMKDKSGTIEADTTTNILYGWPLGTIKSSGDTADSEEFQDQLSGGTYKTFISGGIDPGDVTLNTYFSPTVGKPAITPIVDSVVFTPQFLLLFATTMASDPTKLQVFFAAGVNYIGGGDVNGDIGKIIGSTLKFKISGEPKLGTVACGTVAMSLYDGIKSD